MNDKSNSFLNPVKNRFLPVPRNAAQGLEHEPTIQDFDIIKELGIGSFGEVYLASHKKTKAQFAIKSINKSIPENLEEKANFNREVEIMYKLDHPNIVKLYGHFEDNDFCYFLMQYIPKRSLFDIITPPRQKPNLKLIASVMKDLLSAVYYLHHMKPVIIHRDIKPENILLDDNNKAYLTDFGWSNYMKSNKRRHTVCGTPLYLPPEMVGNFGHDETADIWCVGVLLFELITGVTPFDGYDYETVKMNISKLRICWPPIMDPDAKDLCSKILKLNGKDRLPIEEILSHKFFTKFFPNAVNELIKPEGQENKIFLVSVDNPKTWGHKNTRNSTNINKNTTNYTTNTTTNIRNSANYKNDTLKNINSTEQKYKKIIPVNQNQKRKDIYIPRANIDLSGSTKNERSINKQSNNKYNINSSFGSKTNNSNNTNSDIKKSYTYSTNNYRNSYTKDSSNNNRSSYKGTTSSNYSSKITNKNNIYRNSVKAPSTKIEAINKSYSSEKYRNSYKYKGPIQNKNNTLYNSNTATTNKRSDNSNNIIISSNYYRRSSKPTNQNNSYYNSYTSKK